MNRNYDKWKTAKKALMAFVVSGAGVAWAMGAMETLPAEMDWTVKGVAMVALPLVVSFLKAFDNWRKHAAMVLALVLLPVMAGCATTMSELSTVQTFDDGTKENTTLKTSSRTVAWAKQDEGSGEARYIFEGGELVTGQAAKGQLSDVPLADALAGLAPLVNILQGAAKPTMAETILNSDVLEAAVDGALDRRFGPMVEP